MSSAPDTISHATSRSHGEPSAAGRIAVSIDWLTRPLFGILLAGIAVGATLAGGLAFMILLAAGCAAGAREWHRFFTKGDLLLPTLFTVAAMVGALVVQFYGAAWFHGGMAFMPFAILAVGFVCNFMVGLVRHESPFANAMGAMYIGLPALALFMLRQYHNHALWLVLLVFLSVWATDTGALFSGKLIGGPKLAPALSPNKTWAGSIGGLLCAAVTAGILAALLKATVFPAVVFAAVVSVSGQIGDLFESMVKRRRGHKDSGGLIPGHGGVLDRIDSILFAAPVASFLVLAAGMDPLIGVHR
jgi:phosphatidate cytidylyltransferase